MVASRLYAQADIRTSDQGTQSQSSSNDQIPDPKEDIAIQIIASFWALVMGALDLIGI
jgi:hypothetical protein